MALGRIFSSRLWLNFKTLGRQSSRESSQVVSCSATFGRSRKKCSVSTNRGVSPLMRETGLIRSAGSSWFPQLSHWSPRAPV